MSSGIEYGITVVLTPEQITLMAEQGISMQEAGGVALDHLVHSISRTADEQGSVSFSIVSIGEVPFQDHEDITPLRYVYWMKPTADMSLYEGEGIDFLLAQGHDVDDPRYVRQDGGSVADGDET